MTEISESRARELLQWLDDQAGDHTHLFEQMARYRDAAALIRQLRANEQAAWHAGLDAGREQGKDHAHQPPSAPVGVEGLMQLARNWCLTWGEWAHDADPGCAKESAAEAALRAALTTALARQPAVCPKCDGTGEADSGGIMPWGAPATIPCDCQQPAAVTQSDSGAVSNASAPVGVESEPGAVRTLVTAANAVLALYPGDDQLWTLESAVRPFNATKPAECAVGCPPQQVCDYCQIASLAQQPEAVDEVMPVLVELVATLAVSGTVTGGRIYFPERQTRELLKRACDALAQPGGSDNDR